MKLLLDQNISYKVARLLEDTFPETKHLKTLGLVDAPDAEIWQYPKAKGYTIVTFDSDFIDLSVLRSSLPKVVWLRFGNSTNLKIANKLISNRGAIIEFIKDSNNEIFFLEID
ncbi:DUF5615 family PIN-like protein [Mucilaginibacter sp. RS28]|uniref:DUF5615 family PIN-like protein n=1 Tax=Mucilaginibacter straminoryzae TaxID=2932774 RepID=A0A9X1X182_9SPHI|nr:DUF5615 family PIN-like protein [Mucilaginibacter straminoryzae]MCJ8209362.1 DUF5615 family PIN-like protein [Mucilaginibacter straminoryzae]